MDIKFRNYKHETRFGDDYNKVYDFLKRINSEKITTPNFLPARWVWAMSRPLDDESIKNKMGLWEFDEKLIAIAVFEDGLGDVFICIDPEYKFLKEDVLNYTKKHLTAKNNLAVTISDEDKDFQAIASKNNFSITDSKDNVAVIDLNFDLNYNLPKDFSVVSMADDWDFKKYNKVMWRGFDHDGNPPEDDLEISFRKTMLSSPHLVPKLTVCIANPDGDYVSHCGLWYDINTDYAYVEPVCTDPKYRKMGLGKAAIYETLIRAKKMGAKKAYVISSQEFYYRLGFKPLVTESVWEL